MNKDYTYCNNSECKKKYNCNLYYESSNKINGEEFWTSNYNPDNCPKSVDKNKLK